MGISNLLPMVNDMLNCLNSVKFKSNLAMGFAGKIPG
jgi:hypothetical protein